MKHERRRQRNEAATRRRLLAWALVILAVTGLALAWTVTPLRDLADPRVLLALLQRFGDHGAAPWVLLAGFVVGGLLALPVTVMVVLAVAAFGPVLGFVYALGGATLAAGMNFAIGRLLGHRQVAELTGSRLQAVSLKLREGGVLAIVAARMMPVTHFTIVSLVAGASHIRTRDFLLGTVLGIAPAIAAIAMFYDRLALAAREPSGEHVAVLTLVSLGLLAILFAVRWLARR